MPHSLSLLLTRKKLPAILAAFLFTFSYLQDGPLRNQKHNGTQARKLAVTPRVAQSLD